MSQKLNFFRVSLPAKLSIVVAFAALFASCQMGRAPAPASKVEAARATNTLSASDRMEIFEFVWRTINEKYYDPAFHGVDWAAMRERYRPRMQAASNDQEFYAQFELMLAELRDDHTRFHAPAPPSDTDAAAGSAERGTLGMRLAEVEGQTVVAEVEADSGAARAGIKPGMILRTVNDRPVEELYREIRAVFPGTSSERSMKSLMQTALLYGGFIPQPRRFGFVGLDGREFNAQPSLTPATPPPHVEARRLASGYGYIKFDNWIPPAAERFKEELSKLSDTRALVIDLRANGGGQTDVLLDIASNFFAAPTYYGGFRRRDGKLDRYSTHAPAQLYKQPVVILLDERSASASESFTIFMQESERAFVIGRQSSGATLNQIIQRVKGGGELRVSIRAYISPQGRNAEGTGVVPDQIVPLTIADLRQGRDAALEAAEAYLNAGIK